MKKNLQCYFPLLKTGIKRFLITINLALIITFLNLSYVRAVGVTGLQQLQVSGKVTDSNTGEPLIGATVLVKGTNAGVITSVDGTYSIGVPDGSAILVFTYIGYASREENVSGRTTVNVTMISEVLGLEEVVVVGYGTQKRETLTGSISKVEGAEIAQSPSVNVTTSLAGKLPGLVVNQRTGQPGAENLSILIRGTGTFNNNDPLIIIDGVPRDNTLQDLNAQDIESVTVLKDASAAIYGARAANGVILVTTKQGSQSSPTFNLTFNYAINQPTMNPVMEDAVVFAESYNEAEYYRQGRPATGFVPFYSDEAIQKYRDGSDPILYPNTDWSKVSTRNWAIQKNVNLQASGGSKSVRYLLSFGASDQGGNYVHCDDNYKRYNARVKVDVDLSENLTVGANISAIPSNRNSSVGTDFASILLSNPTVVAIYPNGLIAPGRFRQSSLLSDRRGFNEIKNSPIQSTFTATYKVPFIKGLTLDASYNYDLRNQFQKTFGKPAWYHEYNVITGEYDMHWTIQPIEVRDTYSRWTTSLFNFRISYKKTIAENHNVSAMLGTEQQKANYSYVMAYRKNFVSAAIPQINVGSTSPNDAETGGSASESAYNNFFGRMNYDFKSKYLLEFLFRYDGSQIFPEGKRYGFFPAVSAGWRLSEENFIKNNLPFVNELKLRGSYGELGNDRVPAYQYLQAFQFGNNYVFGGADSPGIYSSTMPNPNITWEVSKKLDFGLEASLWNRLLGVELTIFNETRSNILLQPVLSVSHVFGFPALPDQNIGKVKNHGYELTLTHHNILGELTYSVNANVSFARSKIIYMDEVPPAESYMAQTGHPLGSGLYYKSDGIINTQAEYDNYPHGNGAQVGDIMIVDLNKDGVINGDDRYMTNNSPTPEYVFGLTTYLEYKGFDLTLYFQGQTNAWTYDGGLESFARTNLDNNTVYRATNRWTVNNQEGATMPRADTWQPGATDFFLYDATFIRIKNLEFGYNLGNNLSKKIGLNDVRVFVSGTNLLTWAKEISWRDPEINGMFGTYPPLRIINFGINVKF
jgi:TonB-linked SusC/RagA family outer membrane protein